MHCCVSFLSVWIQSEKSSRAVSPSATKSTPQTQAPTPASFFLSKAQTCWSKSYWDTESPGESRLPASSFLLSISRPVHVPSAAAPQGGGWTRLWGERRLLFLLLYIFLTSCLTFFLLLFVTLLNIMIAWSKRPKTFFDWMLIIHHALIIRVGLCNV